jgi:hypothetical protein
VLVENDFPRHAAGDDYRIIRHKFATDANGVEVFSHRSTAPSAAPVSMCRSGRLGLMRHRLISSFCRLF